MQFVKRHRNLSIVLGAIGLLALALCCVAGGLIAGTGDRAPENPIVTATPSETVREPSSVPTDVEPTETPLPAPTDTLQPTDTPWPTRTPQPTETPQPTRTPRPTATPRFTAAEEEYLDQVATIASEYRQALQDFAEQSAAASNDVSLMFDSAWMTETATVLSRIAMLNEEIRSLDAPSRFTDFHAHLMRAARYSDEFIALFVAGVDEVNATKITRASERLDLATAELTDANEELDALDVFK